jgi:hypothetical protein
MDRRQAFIFVDDGLSGAEFENRPGFVRLMASLGPKKQAPPFHVLILSRESRLDREAMRWPTPSSRSRGGRSEP